MRLDSPIVLTVAGTLAVHALLVIAADALMVTHPYIPEPPTPRIEMFDIEAAPILQPPPPPPVTPDPPAPPVPTEPDPAPPPPPTRVRTSQPTRPTEQPTSAVPTPVTEPSPTPTPGGDQVVTLDVAAPGAIGVPVAVGKRTTGRVGRGGAGGGTGSGAGVGSGEIPTVAAPMSVATIKTRALPKGDYGYFDASRDYPAEAKQLGIEGQIRVKLTVDATGAVTGAVLLNRLGHGLDELALQRARQIKFEPAKDTDDKPVSSVLVWTFDMTLPK